MAQLRMNVQAPIDRLFAERWSTRAFDPDKPVSPEHLAACLEAARWAPSCFGEQPWRYMVMDRFTDADAWGKSLATLVPNNQRWAQHAPILLVAVAEPAYSHNGNPNRWAEYDAGQATICLCLQAAKLGLATHQMGGFDVETLKQQLAIPDSMHVMSVTALGFPGDVAALDADFQPMESASRTRKPLQDIVHAGHWGKAWQPPAGAGWEARYQETAVDCLPWYHDALDPDVEQALAELAMKAGHVLDIGCGPGTQSIALAKRGFSVTATDISPSAVESSRQLADTEGVSLACHVDDVLDSRLADPFDLIVDRGVFHCFPEPADQQAYLTTIRHLLKPQGTLLLKCFHKNESSEMGPPCRYDEADIRRLFADGFELLEARNTHFGSDVLERQPKALFCILRKTPL